MVRQPSPNEGRYKNDSRYVMMMGSDGRMHYYRQADDEVLDAMKGSTQTVMGDMRAMRESQERQAMMDNLIESVQVGIDTFYDLLEEELTFQLNGREISQEEAENHIRNSSYSWPQPWEPVEYDQYGRVMPKKKEPGLFGSLSLVLKGWLKDKLFGKYVGTHTSAGYIMPPRGAVLSGRNVEFPIENFVNRDPEEMAREAEEFKEGVEEAAEKRDTENREGGESSTQHNAHQNGEGKDGTPADEPPSDRAWELSGDTVDSASKRMDITEDFLAQGVDISQNIYKNSGIEEPTDTQIDQALEKVHQASIDAMRTGMYKVEVARFFDSQIGEEGMKEMKDSGMKELPPEVSSYLFKSSVARAMIINEANRRFPEMEDSEGRRKFLSESMGKLKESFITKDDEENFIRATEQLKKKASNPRG